NHQEIISPPCPMSSTDSNSLAMNRGHSNRKAVLPAPRSQSPTPCNAEYVPRSRPKNLGRLPNPIGRLKTHAKPRAHPLPAFPPRFLAACLPSFLRRDACMSRDSMWHWQRSGHSESRGGE
ncbi:hypothetical protein ACLOJK_010023, partial [Asimina triloba]